MTTEATEDDARALAVGLWGPAAHVWHDPITDRWGAACQSGSDEAVSGATLDELTHWLRGRIANPYEPPEPEPEVIWTRERGRMRITASGELEVLSGGVWAHFRGDVAAEIARAYAELHKRTSGLAEDYEGLVGRLREILEDHECDR